MRDRYLELSAPEEVVRDVMNRVLRCQVKGLDAEACKDAGIFQRISYLLSGLHTLNLVAYRLHGGICNLLDVMDADAREIKQANNAMQRAVDAYIKFWSGYYKNNEAVKEMNGEAETLYHQFMKWAQLPEGWHLGDAQQTDGPSDAMIELTEPGEDRVLRFYRSVAQEEPLSDAVESWMVTRYDVKTKRQESVEEGMDKGSAMMVAKRLSADDRKNIYTASLCRTVDERRTEIYPMKAFQANATIGSMKKSVKKR